MMKIKDSSLAKMLRKMMGVKDVRDNLSDEEIIKLNFYECICYLYKGSEKPIVTGFRQDVNTWLITSVGLIELDSIPHDEGHLTNNVYELETLIGENGFDNKKVLKMINESLDENWKK